MPTTKRKKLGAAACHDCGAPTSAGGRATRCETCAAKDRDREEKKREAREKAGLCRNPNCERPRYRDLATCWECAFPGVEMPKEGDDQVDPYFPSDESEEEKRRRYRLFRRM